MIFSDGEQAQAEGDQQWDTLKRMAEGPWGAGGTRAGARRWAEGGTGTGCQEAGDTGEILEGKGFPQYRRVRMPPTVPRGNNNKCQIVGGSGGPEYLLSQQTLTNNYIHA